MKKKMLATILTVAMTASLFAGCGGSKDTGSSNDAANNDAAQTAEADADKRDVGGLKLPISTSGEELTIWLVYSGTMVSDLNEIESVKKMEENTGVHVTWIPVEQNEIKDKYGILLSSGDYPDIIYSNMEYPGGFAKGIEDGVIHEDMDTLIRENMPNYMALINSSDEARREATSDEGKMLVVKTIVGRDKTAESEGTYQGLGYRADLLEKLGMDVPTTVDGWHDVLVKAKESGIQNPFVLDTNGGSPLAQSWGVSTEGVNYWMMLKGDKVTNGAVEDGFAGYLETMRQWYSEGLINPNFTSFNYYLDTPNSINGNDGILYSRILSAFTGKNYSNFHMVTEQPDEYIQAIAAPALKEGDKVVQCANRIIAKEGMYITSSCKNPELAAKWLGTGAQPTDTVARLFKEAGITK
ncbi:MAG: extracellular solute-binding protein [Pseudobutyrivibrio sp.]|nr:extracellular solute-binding protein [Pseudobutyrivibrio sp.]